MMNGSLNSTGAKYLHAVHQFRQPAQKVQPVCADRGVFSIHHHLVEEAVDSLT